MRQEHGEFYSRGLVLYPIVLQEGPGTVPYYTVGEAWYCTILYCSRGLVLYPIVL